MFVHIAAPPPVTLKHEHVFFLFSDDAVFSRGYV